MNTGEGTEWGMLGLCGGGGKVGRKIDEDLGFGKTPHAAVFWEETQFTLQC